jgi:flagellar hook-length control protein FliK
MNPESSLLNVPILPRADRTAMQAPARTHIDAGTGSSPGVARERRDDPLASFGDAITRARRDAEQQTARRAHGRAAGDTEDVARTRARSDDTRSQTRSDHDAGGGSDAAARDRVEDSGVARHCARSGETSTRDGAAGRRAAARDPAEAAVPTVSADGTPAALADPAAPIVSPDPAAMLVDGAAAPAVSVDAEAPTLPGEAADAAADARAGGPDAADAAGSAPAVSASIAPATPPVALPAADAARAIDPPVDDAPVEPAAAAARDHVAAPPAAGAERIAHGTPRFPPRPTLHAAADPALAPTTDASSTEAIDDIPAADTFSREAMATMARHSPGDATGRFGPSGAAAFTVAAAGTTLQAPAAPQGVQPPTVGSIPTPLAHPAFGNHFATEVASLALRGIERAEIVLNPRELGPVRIELSLNGETARVAFSAAQPETRQAIEQTLPILEDMLAEHGLLLSGSSVSDGRAGREPGGDAGRPAAEAVGAQASAFDARQAGLAGTHAPHAARGLLDLYA